MCVLGFYHITTNGASLISTKKDDLILRFRVIKPNGKISLDTFSHATFLVLKIVSFFTNPNTILSFRKKKFPRSKNI